MKLGSIIVLWLSYHRELYNDSMLFKFDSAEDKAKSDRRKDILRDIVVSVGMPTADTNEKKLAALKAFWDTVVKSCFDSDMSMPSSSSADAPVPASTLSPSKSRAKNMLESMPSIDAFDSDFVEASLRTSSASSGASSKTASMSSLEPVLTCAAYRDIVLVGMEKILKVRYDFDRKASDVDIFTYLNLDMELAALGSKLLLPSPSKVSIDPPKSPSISKDFAKVVTSASAMSRAVSQLKKKVTR